MEVPSRCRAWDNAQINFVRFGPSRVTRHSDASSDSSFEFPDDTIKTLFPTLDIPVLDLRAWRTNARRDRFPTVPLPPRFTYGNAVVSLMPR